MSSWDNEKAPTGKVLLPEGWRRFTITYGESTVSKAGNNMFKITLEDKETGYPTTIYVVRTPGKRWTLKQILDATETDKQEDDDYDYVPELLEKDLLGKVIHEDNNWINRNGDEIKDKQHKIVDFKKDSKNPDGVNQASEIKWDN